MMENIFVKTLGKIEGLQEKNIKIVTWIRKSWAVMSYKHYLSLKPQPSILHFSWLYLSMCSTNVEEMFSSTETLPINKNTPQGTF